MGEDKAGRELVVSNREGSEREQGILLIHYPLLNEYKELSYLSGVATLRLGDNEENV